MYDSLGGQVNQGLHEGPRGVVLTVRSADGGREGVTGRIVGCGVSPSARRMN